MKKNNMELKEVFESLYFKYWVLFADSNDVEQKINKDDCCYYDFIVNDDEYYDDFDELKDSVKHRLFEVDELPKYVYIFEADDEYLTLKKSAPFTPTEEEIKDIFGDE